MVPVECYFVLSALLFAIGVFGFVTRRNLIAMLISIELIINAVDINFAAFNRIALPDGQRGYVLQHLLYRNERCGDGSGLLLS